MTQEPLNVLQRLQRETPRSRAEARSSLVRVNVLAILAIVIFGWAVINDGPAILAFGPWVMDVVVHGTRSPPPAKLGAALDVFIILLFAPNLLSLIGNVPRRLRIGLTWLCWGAFALGLVSMFVRSAIKIGVSGAIYGVELLEVAAGLVMGVMWGISRLRVTRRAKALLEIGQVMLAVTAWIGGQVWWSRYEDRMLHVRRQTLATAEIHRVQPRAKLISINANESQACGWLSLNGGMVVPFQVQGLDEASAAIPWIGQADMGDPRARLGAAIERTQLIWLCRDLLPPRPATARSTAQLEQMLGRLLTNPVGRWVVISAIGTPGFIGVRLQGPGQWFNSPVLASADAVRAWMVEHPSAPAPGT